MKEIFGKTIIKAAIIGASLVFATSAYTASIADTWHNLGSGNTMGSTPNGDTPANSSANTAEICVFCHTPHGGDNTAAVPLWNRNITAAPTYTRYSDLGTSTFDAQEAPIGSVTIACLSCHDGTQAIDSVINQPGSGGYDPAGARIGNFSGADQVNGVLASGIVQNIGTDLSNDHPVSMQYGGGGLTGNNGTVSGTTNDRDFSSVSGMPASSATVNTLFWIERGADSLNAGARDREDVILYTRDDLGAVEPFVECGSCHDPHNAENQTFLRVSNTGPNGSFPDANGGPSALCLTCHIK